MTGTNLDFGVDFVYNFRFRHLPEVRNARKLAHTALIRVVQAETARTKGSQVVRGRYFRISRISETSDFGQVLQSESEMLPEIGSETRSEMSSRFFKNRHFEQCKYIYIYTRRKIERDKDQEDDHGKLS